MEGGGAEGGGSGGGGGSTGDPTSPPVEKREREIETENVSLRKRLSLLTVTSDEGDNQELGSEVNDKPMEFSFTGEIPSM